MAARPDCKNLAPEWVNYVKTGSLRSPPAGLALNERRDYMNQLRVELHKEFFGPIPGKKSQRLICLCFIGLKP